MNNILIGLIVALLALKAFDFLIGWYCEKIERDEERGRDE